VTSGGQLDLSLPYLSCFSIQSGKLQIDYALSSASEGHATPQNRYWPYASQPVVHLSAHVRRRSEGVLSVSVIARVDDHRKLMLASLMRIQRGRLMGPTEMRWLSRGKCARPVAPSGASIGKMAISAGAKNRKANPNPVETWCASRKCKADLAPGFSIRAPLQYSQHRPAPH